MINLPQNSFYVTVLLLKFFNHTFTWKLVSSCLQMKNIFNFIKMQKTNKVKILPNF